jgi:hypothetical protein
MFRRGWTVFVETIKNFKLDYATNQNIKHIDRHLDRERQTIPFIGHLNSNLGRILLCYLLIIKRRIEFWAFAQIMLSLAGLPIFAETPAKDFTWRTSRGPRIIVIFYEQYVNRAWCQVFVANQPNEPSMITTIEIRLIPYFAPLLLWFDYWKPAVMLISVYSYM